jgi:hypothetical protein
MKLTKEQLRQLKDAFNKAAETSPEPYKPVMNPGNLRMSPRQLAYELERETPTGKYFIRVIEDTITYGGIPFSSVIKQLTERKPPKP